MAGERLRQLLDKALATLSADASQQAKQRLDALYPYVMTAAVGFLIFFVVMSLRLFSRGNETAKSIRKVLDGI